MSWRPTWKPRMTETGPTLVANEDGSCCYRGCEALASVRRITRRGWFMVLYCAIHEREAARVFGLERFEAVS